MYYYYYMIISGFLLFMQAFVCAMDSTDLSHKNRVASSTEKKKVKRTCSAQQYTQLHCDDVDVKRASKDDVDIELVKQKSVLMRTASGKKLSELFHMSKKNNEREQFAVSEKEICKLFQQLDQGDAECIKPGNINVVHPKTKETPLIYAVKKMLEHEKKAYMYANIFQKLIEQSNTLNFDKQDCQGATAIDIADSFESERMRNIYKTLMQLEAMQQSTM